MTPTEHSSVSPDARPLAVRPSRVHVSVDLRAVTARFRADCQAELAAGSAGAVGVSALDVPALIAEVSRLYGLLMDERRRYADLWAAIRATVGADSDGEPDPVQFLRDEFPDLLSGRGPEIGDEDSHPDRLHSEQVRDDKSDPVRRWCL